MSLLARLYLRATRGSGKAVAQFKDVFPGGVSRESMRYREDLSRMSQAMDSRLPNLKDLVRPQVSRLELCMLS